MFDGDAFRAAHRPWSFTLGGRTFGAKHVSAPVVLKYEHKVLDAAALSPTYPKRAARARTNALRWLLRHAFPFRVDYWMRGDPVSIILALEPALRNEALADFFACLQGENRTTTVTLPPSKTPTPGTRSRAPIPLRSP